MLIPCFNQLFFIRRATAHCRLSGWLAPYRGSSTGEGQCAAGVTVGERGGTAPALWADVDAVRVG
jgi:hypothetical protein